ncbi:MAG: hypothetical protein JXM69_03865 [Anaerolineae bacterium]|nr:hypothetical protein [Anaerolineae bacterium]
MKKDQAPRRRRTILARQLAAQQEITGELAQDFAAYEATFDEIEAATEPLDAYRPEFEKILNNPKALADRAKKLFAEDRFEPYRYTEFDVHRVCEASAYTEPPARTDPEYIQFLTIATTFLADRKHRLQIAQKLLHMIPDYLAEKRYMDAWMVQFCAYHMAETTNEANPFLVQMFEYGLNLPDSIP